MASNIENDEGHGPEDEQGEDRPILSAPRLVEGVRDLLLRWFKEAHLQKPWPQMSEGDQRTWINRIEERAHQLVDEVIEHVNHGDFPVVNAKIDSFTVKNGEVKVVTKGFADNDMLAILNSAGEKRVQITVMHTDQFNQAIDPLHPDPDQPGLPGVKMGEPGFEDDDEDEGAADVQAEEQAEGEAILTPKSDQWRGGFNSRMGGHAREDNPFGIGEAEHLDWDAGWDAADFDAQAPALNGKPAGEVSGESQQLVEPEPDPAPEPKPKAKRTPKPKAGPVVEPDIEPEDVLPIPDRKPEVGPVPTDGDGNADGAITDEEGTVIESVEHAARYGAWCRSDGKGTGSNPFPSGGEFFKAWLRGYSEQRRKEQENPPVDDGF